jgi:hypothetical protein
MSKNKIMSRLKFMYLLGKSKTLYKGKVRSVRFVKFLKFFRNNKGGN